MTYAVIRTGGKQYRVEPGTTLRVATLPGDAGAKIEFKDVLLGSDGKSVKTGVPLLAGAKVTGEIVKHGRGEKIIVFKFKAKKRYRRRTGHRQSQTRLTITGISA